MVWTTRVLSSPREPQWAELERSHPMARAIVPMWEVQSGWTPRALGVFAGDRLAGGLLLMLRRLPGPLTLQLARIPIVMVGPEDAEGMLSALLDELETQLEAEHVVEVDVRLHLPANDAVPGFEYQAAFWKQLGDRGYEMLRTMDHTYFVDIQRSDEDLLASFESETRRMIKKADKAKVQVEAVRDPKMLERFYDCYVAMVDRKGAPMLPKSLIVDGMAPLLEDDKILLLTGSYDGVIANMAIIDTLGIPEGMLATRSPQSVKSKVPGAGQALQLEAMRRMRDAGKPFYNLGGAEGPKPIRGHPNYGVWRYKYGFRGMYIDFLPYFRKARSERTKKLMDVIHRLRGDYT